MCDPFTAAKLVNTLSEALDSAEVCSVVRNVYVSLDVLTLDILGEVHEERWLRRRRRSVSARGTAGIPHEWPTTPKADEANR